jgi:MinD-like ATPase involved in chromosome partitioning or flagellar assembly
MKNVFAFHGVDHKCGTSMICQSVAERIAEEFPGITILVVHTEGRSGIDYSIGTEESMDRIKPYLEEGILDVDEVFTKSKWKDNLYMVAGSSQMDSAHSFHPDMSDCFLTSMKPRFDLILCDSGSEIEHGLALGSLFSADGVFIVVIPGESALRRYEALSSLYQKLELNILGYIINCFNTQAPYNKAYLKDRLNLPEELSFTVQEAAQGRQAEAEGHTLLYYRNIQYGKDITSIANRILNHAGFDQLRERKKTLWKNSK